MTEKGEEHSVETADEALTGPAVAAPGPAPTGPAAVAAAAAPAAAAAGSAVAAGGDEGVEGIDAGLQNVPLETQPSVAKLLQVPLPSSQIPDRLPGRKGSSTRGTGGWMPKKVREISVASLLQAFWDLGFVQTLFETTSTERGRQRLDAHFLVASSARRIASEAGIIDVIRTALQGVCLALETADLPALDVVNGAKFAQGGKKMDFAVMVSEGDAGLIAGETKKRIWDFLASSICDFGTCELCDLPGSAARGGTTAHGGRHANICDLRQAYRYMVNSGVFYGMLSSYNKTVFLMRDCHGNLLVTPSLAYNLEGGDWVEGAVPTTATMPQLFALFAMMADRCRDGPQCDALNPGVVAAHVDGNQPGTVPEPNFLRSCSGDDCTGNHGPHTTLPASCMYPPANMGATGAADKCESEPLFKVAGMLCPLNYNALERVGDPLPPQRMGFVTRVRLPDGTVGVLKIADLAKSDGDDRTPFRAEMAAEVTAYKRLEPMQGDGVPRLLAYGHFQQRGLYGILTSDEGVDATTFDADIAVAESAAEIIERIHEFGVEHCDLRPNNVVRKRDTGKVSIIDFGMAKVSDIGCVPERRRDAELVEVKYALS